MIRSVVDHRRELHSCAETGFNLPRTRDYLCRCLSESGYKPEIIGQGSVIAVKRGDIDKYILLRADMDALTMREQSGLTFASTNGNMHACGHDMHSAMLLSTAEQLSRQSTRCGIIFLFQAAEETLCGARDVIQTGLLSNYDILSAISIHVLTGIEIPIGTVIIPQGGVVAPGADVIRIDIHGKSAHGSTTNLGKSSIMAAVNIMENTDRVLNNVLPPSELRVMNWGKITGGLAANTVAEKTILEGNFRYRSTDERNHFLSRLHKICKASEAITECQINMRLIGGCPPLKNDESIVDLFKRELMNKLPRVLAADELGTESNSLGGSDDFSHFCAHIPSVMLSLAAGRPSEGYAEPLHTPKTDFDERSLEIGVSTYKNCIIVIEKSLPN